MERLEQRAAVRTGDVNGTVLYIHDGSARPYDRVEYRETYGGETKTLVRDGGESWPDLKRRALANWGLVGKRLMLVHFVGSNGRGGPRFTAAEYEAIGVLPQ